MTLAKSLDMSAAELAIVQEILFRHVPKALVWVFGSRATGRAKKFSDLDLCIKADKPLGLNVMSALAEDFSESDLPWKVDVVDWSTTNPDFRKIIDQDKMVLEFN